MTKTATGGFAALCAWLLITGCAASSLDTTPTPTPSPQTDVREQIQPGGKLIYGVGSETIGWSPASSQWASSGLLIARQVFDTLAAFDDHNDIQPFAAERFDHNADFTEWTIVLRPGMVLHNGKPVTAEVVARNQTYLMHSQLTSAAYAPVVGFTADGPLQVKVALNEPWTTYPAALASQIGVIADPDWLESGDTRNPVGSGPFKFGEWVPGKSLTVTRNDRYWRKDAKGVPFPYLESVEFRPIIDDTARQASLRDGTIQAMLTTSAEHVASFGGDADFKVYSTGSDGETAETFTMLNTAKAPFDDIDARRALAYAIDKNAVSDIVSGGSFPVANGPYAPGSKWYTPDVEARYPQYDQGKARELVDKVKARNGGRFAFTLVLPPNGTFQLIAPVLQQQWRDVGIEANIDVVDQVPLIVRVLTGDYQAVVWQQFDYPNPVGDSVWWLPSSVKPIPEIALNFARNRDERIGAKLIDARQTTDPDREKADYQEVQRLLAEDVPYLWLYHNQVSVIASKDVHDVDGYDLPPNGKGEVHRGLGLNNGAHPLAQTWIHS